jgi:hypothetical protein
VIAHFDTSLSSDLVSISALSNGHGTQFPSMSAPRGYSTITPSWRARSMPALICCITSR